MCNILEKSRTQLNLIYSSRCSNVIFTGCTCVTVTGFSTEVKYYNRDIFVNTENKSGSCSIRCSMQENLNLRRGRGRGYNRGDKSFCHNQPRIPVIPPFPFHQQHFFNLESSQRALTSSLSRGQSNLVSRGLSHPVSRGLYNPVSRDFGFNCRGSSPRFPILGGEELRAAQCNFIPCFPKPRPNTLIQEEWDVLNRNGRPTHKSLCVVVCCCTFGEGDAVQRIFSFCCSENPHTEHSEKKAIQQVIMLENECGRDLRKMILIISRSPCIPCAKDMITLVQSRRFSMNLYFTALQKEINPDRNGIGLLASIGIPMRIADDYIWSYLTSLLAIYEGEPKTTFSDGNAVNKIDRKAWDEVWSQQLGAVLHHDLPNLLNCQNLLNKFNDVQRRMTENAQRTL